MSILQHKQLVQEAPPALLAALSLDAIGYRVTPVIPRKKKPILPMWQRRLIPTSELAEHFDSNQNVGILLGPKAGGIVDIDLDHPIAIKLAPAYLPATGAKFGRESARASHWMYRVSEPAVTQKVTAPQDGPLGGASLLELRAGSKKGTCQQTVGPGSIHQDAGELIEWEPGADGVPAEIELSELIAAFQELAAACLDRLAGSEREGTQTGELESLAGCNRARAETGEDNQNPAPVLTCSHLNTPVRGKVYQSVESLILDCLPTGPGQRRECMFRLARGLKHNLGWGDSPARDELFRVFWLWMDQARPNVRGDTPESESMLEFLDGYFRAEIPLGLSATVVEALKLIEARGLPPEALELGGKDEGVPRLIGVCWAKQFLVGPLTFALAVSECAKVMFPQKLEDPSLDDQELNRLRSRAYRMRSVLERLDLLCCTDRGIKGPGRKGASRFRYIGRSTPYPYDPSELLEVA